jgi:Tfp pilus assembly protein PilO
LKVTRQELIAVIALVVLGVVVAIAGLVLAVLPQRSHAKSLDAEIAATQAKLISLQQNGHRGPVIRAAQLFQLAHAMPDSADMPGLIVDLARAARDAKVSLLSVSPSPPIAQPDGANAVPLKISLVGSWTGIAKFLHELRSNVRVKGGKLSVDGRLFTVDTVELSPNAPAVSSASGTPSAATAPSGELAVSLSVNAFSYGTPPAPVVTTSTDTTTTTSSADSSVQASGSVG